MAVEIITKTVGLELAPFRVKVFSVVPALKNMGQSHFDNWKLAKDSLHAPLDEIIRQRRADKKRS
ncbi:hypothetical protein SLS63_011879 [Diaporthe eres]|uniref:Uncharacterized protein n=1 Tax=Diaporthe eres TaxID=83184 RepID=A0ABR1NSW2_DIAER